MKKLLLIIAIISSTISLNFAQEKDSKDYKDFSNTIKLSTLPFINNTFQISYERFLKDDKSLEFLAGYTYSDNYNNEKEGFNMEVQYKYFVFENISRKTTQRLYFAPYFSFHYTDLTEERYHWNQNMEDYYTTENYIINSYRGGVLVGFNWILAERISLDIYLGGGIRKTNNFERDEDNNYYDDIWEPGYNGIAPKIGIDIGINF